MRYYDKNGYGYSSEEDAERGNRTIARQQNEAQRRSVHAAETTRMAIEENNRLLEEQIRLAKMTPAEIAREKKEEERKKREEERERIEGEKRRAEWVIKKTQETLKHAEAVLPEMKSKLAAIDNEISEIQSGGFFKRLTSGLEEKKRNRSLLEVEINNFLRALQNQSIDEIKNSKYLTEYERRIREKDIAGLYEQIRLNEEQKNLAGGQSSKTPSNIKMRSMDEVLSEWMRIDPARARKFAQDNGLKLPE
jgi:hypothetical protein